MADENVPAPAPTRSNDQILPFAAWNTLTYEAKTGAYSFELDETRFVLDANLLREALEIAPIDQAHHPTKKGRKDKPYVISYCRFTKLIIFHLGRIHNIYQRSTSPYHLVEEDLRLGNLKFVHKGEADEEGKKKPTTAKQPKPKPAKKKSSKPVPLPKPKVTKEKSTKPPTAIKTMVEGKGKDIATEEQAVHSLLALHTPKRRSTTSQFILQKQTPATEEASTGPSVQPQYDASANIVHESSSPVDAETVADTYKTSSGGDTEILQIDEDQRKEVDNQVNLKEKTARLDQGQVGLDPGKTPESRPQPKQEFMEEDQAGPDPRVIRVALTRPNHEPTHEEFMANVYTDVHGSLKLPADEHVMLEEPLSSTDILSSIKNLDDAYTFGDQFINDKSTKDELSKLNMESKVVSMVTVPIHQVSSSVPPLSTPIIDLYPLKPASSTTQAPIFTATTTTTKTTLPLLPPLPQQSTLDSESRVFTLELRDLHYKIYQTANEVVKEAVHVALQTPLRDRFRELLEADMKEILHQWMFESEHVALYEALEASMDQENRDKFLAENDNSRKRHDDDQDPPPPPPGSNLSKKRRHDLGTSRSAQPSAPQSSAWKTFDTRETPSSSSRQQLASHSEQPIKDVPIIDNANALANSFKDLVENKLLQKTGDMGSFITWFCDRIGKKKLSKSDLEGPTFKVAKAFHKNSISLQFQMKECHRMLMDQVDLVNPEGHRLVLDVSKPFPQRGPPGRVTILSQYFFNKDLEYLVSRDKHKRLALSISKLKTAYYLDFRLEELVPSL
nr:hypothetical protein [Tanacetum cinerariifolium]